MPLSHLAVPVRSLATAALALVLAACGGGSSSSSSPVVPASPAPVTPPPTPAPVPATYLLGGTVSGLADGAVINIANGSDGIAVSANGNFALPARLVGGAAYNVTATTPAGHVCSIVDGAGTVGTVDVGKVAVKCTAFLLAGKAMTLNNAYAVAVDAAGTRYVLDSLAQVVLRIDGAGAVSVLAGSRNVRGHRDGAGAAASFWTNSASRMAFDPKGNLVLTDTCNGLVRSITPAGVVSTLAGTLQPGCTLATALKTAGSSDGAALKASFALPGRLAIDANGTIVIAESSRRALRQIDGNGIVSTVDPLGPTANLRTSALAFNARNELFVASNSENQRRIWRVANGVAVLVAGGPASRDPLPPDSAAIGAGFLTIRALAADRDGNLFIADGSSVRKLTAAGVVANVAGSTARTLDGVGAAAYFSVVSDMAIDAQGTLSIVQSDTGQLRSLTSAGAVVTSAATPPHEYADGKGSAARFSASDYLASGPDGSIYTLDINNHVIRKISADGTVSRFAGIAGTSGGADGAVAGATLNAPVSLAVDKAGVVYFIDANGLRKVSGGVVSTVKASPDLREQGYYMRVLADGGFVLGGAENVRILDSAGAVSALIDGDMMARATNWRGTQVMGATVGLEVDGSGNIYIADGFFSMVFKYSKAGVLSKFAGTALITGSADGAVDQGSLSFEVASDIAIDPAGNLYLTGQSMVRKITPDGVLSTPTLAWGMPAAFGITVANGLLYGSGAGTVMQTPLP